MARQKARNEALEFTLIQKAGARCTCQGQCGNNHNWEPGYRALRCAAPHGCNVVRKIDNPSCWRLADLQGFQSDSDKGPRTHLAGKYVTHGSPLIGELAFKELFDLKSVTQIWLSTVSLEADREPTVFCQFCARHLRSLRVGLTV